MKQMYVLPCKSIAKIDPDCCEPGSGYIAYRCTSCFAVPGSMGMPKECARLMKEADEKRRKRRGRS